MFNNASGGAGNKESAVQKSIGGLGTAAGIVTAICLSPHIYHSLKAPMVRYLTELYGTTFAGPMTWLLGVVTAFIVYFTAKLLCTSALTWLWMAIGKRSV